MWTKANLWDANVSAPKPSSEILLWRFEKAYIHIRTKSRHVANTKVDHTWNLKGVGWSLASLHRDPSHAWMDVCWRRLGSIRILQLTFTVWQPLPSHCPITLSVWWHLSQSIWELVVCTGMHVCSSCVCIYTYACVHVLGGGRGQPQMLLLRDHPSWFGDLELAGQARAAYQQALGIHLPVPAGCCAYKQGPAPARHPHSHCIYATPPLTAFYQRTC